MPPELLENSITAAKNLLGWKLIHKTPEGLTSGYVVETEAYHQDDPASHAFGGERPRNSVMYREPGTIYVYFIYGMYYCFNIVTGPVGRGEAVLIRAVEPIQGIELMKRRRGIDDERKLTNGPAKLVQAFGITKAHSGTMINDGALRLEPGIMSEEITQTTRIGITKAADQPWRFFITGNQFVSKPLKI